MYPKFVTPWTAVCQAPLYFTISRDLLKFMLIESVMEFNNLILWCPLLLSSIFPSIRSFPMRHFFPLGGQSFGASTSASVLPMNIHDWLLLGLTGLISLQSLIQHHSLKASIFWHSRFLKAPLSIHMWPLKRPQFELYALLWAKWCLCFLICNLMAESEEELKSLLMKVKEWKSWFKAQHSVN